MEREDVNWSNQRIGSIQVANGYPVVNTGIAHFVYSFWRREVVKSNCVAIIRQDYLRKIETTTTGHNFYTLKHQMQQIRRMQLS